MTDNTNTEWRAGDIEGKTWCVYRWSDNHVEYVPNPSGKTKRFRFRSSAMAAANVLNAKMGA